MYTKYIHTQIYSHLYTHMQTNTSFTYGYALRNENMLVRTNSGVFFKMKHFQKPDIVRMGGEGWANHTEREVFADRLTKVHVAFPSRGERLGTAAAQQNLGVLHSYPFAAFTVMNEVSADALQRTGKTEKQRGWDYSHVCPFPLSGWVRQVIKR